MDNLLQHTLSGVTIHMLYRIRQDKDSERTQTTRHRNFTSTSAEERNIILEDLSLLTGSEKRLCGSHTG